MTGPFHSCRDTVPPCGRTDADADGRLRWSSRGKHAANKGNAARMRAHIHPRLKASLTSRARARVNVRRRDKGGIESVPTSVRRLLSVSFLAVTSLSHLNPPIEGRRRRWSTALASGTSRCYNVRQGFPISGSMSHSLATTKVQWSDNSFGSPERTAGAPKRVQGEGSS